MQGITAAQLYEERRNELDLEVIIEAQGARLPITVSDVNRPGLALAGFTENFLYERIQILGETEMLYLDTLTPEGRRKGIDRLFERDLPCLIVSKGLPIDPYLGRLCEERRCRCSARACPPRRSSTSSPPT
jgi:HPr kinase/phosphorylase